MEKEKREKEEMGGSTVGGSDRRVRRRIARWGEGEGWRRRGGTVAAHYYEAELPNFAGRYVVSTSRSPPSPPGLERGW